MPEPTLSNIPIAIKPADAIPIQINQEAPTNTGTQPSIEITPEAEVLPDCPINWIVSAAILLSKNVTNPDITFEDKLSVLETMEVKYSLSDTQKQQLNLAAIAIKKNQLKVKPE